MKTLNKIFAWLFIALAVASACGILFKGAWWHIGTLAIAATMAKAIRTETKQQEEVEP